MIEIMSIVRRIASVDVINASLIIALCSAMAFGQTAAVVKCPEKSKQKAVKLKDAGKYESASYTGSGRSGKYASWFEAPRTSDLADSMSEKAIAVRSNVYVSICVKQGTVKVNGWARDEVRAFLKGGKELDFKVIERAGKDKMPVWIEILEIASGTKGSPGDKCLSGDLIELDVPEGASITIKGLSSETSIDTVKRVTIEIVGGDILLNNIADRIDASTQQGGVTVNNSSGKVSVATTTGSIVAYNTVSVETGDYFKAKTRSGAVTLQSIGQKEVIASSISGSINYLGEIKNYGRYAFTTTNGLINLVIPPESSFWITAAFGGQFVTDFPVTVITENETDSAVYLNGRVGKGEASLNLRSFSGSIRIRKQETPGAGPVEVRVL